jgi:hypothetical protein
MATKQTTRKQDLLSQRDKIKLNDDLEIILMKPGETMLLTWGKKVDEVRKILAGVKFSTFSVAAGKDAIVTVTDTLGLSKDNLVTIIDNPPVPEEVERERKEKGEPKPEPLKEEATITEIISSTQFKVAELKNSYITPIVQFNWAQQPETAQQVMRVVKAFLIQCVRDPEDYHKKLIVDDDEIPGQGQENFGDFNPAIIPRLLAKQEGSFSEEELKKISKTPVYTPKIILFQQIIQKSGWYLPPETEESVESFPAVGEGNKKTDDSPTV